MGRKDTDMENIGARLHEAIRSAWRTCLLKQGTKVLTKVKEAAVWCCGQTVPDKVTEYLVQPCRDGFLGTVQSQAPSSSSCPSLYNLLGRRETRTRDQEAVSVFIQDLGLQSRLALNPQSSRLSLPSTRTTRMCHQMLYTHFKIEFINF